jgi:hypothetical protein
VKISPLVLAVFAVVTICAAQTPVQNLYAVGGSYNINATPSIAGSALYAHLTIPSTSTYTFTAVDVLPTPSKPFTVTSNIGAGLAQKIFSISKADLYTPTTAGVSWTGSNTGWQWTGGAAAVIPIKRNFCLVPTVRFLKSSVSGGTGYQPIVGLSIGWAK